MGEEPRAYFFVVTGIVFVVCMSLLIFIFVPKMIYHRKKDKLSRKDTISNSLPKMSMESTSTECTNSSLETEGSLIIDHPKLRQNLQQQNKKLTETNEKLSRRVAEIEKIFK